jgi:hypothetical protein
VENRFSEEKRERLEHTWGHEYRLHALPLIDEALFSRFFHEDNGRPNKSVRLVVSVLVLKEMFDLTDRETLEQLEWNAVWQYALDVVPDEAHSCQKTLHNFRVHVLGNDEGARLFEDVTGKIIKAAALRTARQRLDSTHIVSNIRLLTRIGLFVATITAFLSALRKVHPRLYNQVPESIRGRYMDREGYFGDVKSSEAPRRQAEAALDTYALVSQWQEHKAVSGMAEYGLVVRLYKDQCVPPDIATPTKVELEEMPSSSSLQSPSDPDVTYGHKGKGYEAQIAETCAEENPFEVITAVIVNSANESDQQAAIPMIVEVAKTCGKVPEKMHSDAGYGSGENIIAAREMGTELLAPIGAKASESQSSLAQFEFDGSGQQVVRCPAGHSPAGHGISRNGLRVIASFPLATCAQCPLADSCPTRPRRNDRVLEWSAADLARSLRRQEQQTPYFKEQHKIRSGIEATNSELKRCHGLRKLRVRGKARVGLSVRLKTLALNVKRYLAHLVRQALCKTSPTEVFSLA